MIKFRAWDKRRKEMWKVATLHIEDEYADLFKTNIYEKPFNDPWAKFEDLILMQSTGLKDKNGVDIFEGDVLRVYEIDDTVGESEYISPVIWKDYGWLVYDTDTDIPLCLLDRDSDWVDKDVEIEVLGNIHANPELLSSGIE